MKIKPEHYAIMLAAMKDTQAAQPRVTRAYYETNKIGKDSAKRHRWDLMYASGLTRFVCEQIYVYADDMHIDTALKAIVKTLETE